MGRYVAGVSAPTLQSSLNYLLLGVVYTSLHVSRNGWHWRCAWWAYALLALLDVEGNFCLVLAYRYTSLTSVTLLDCFTIPMSVLLSTALLGAAYRRRHYAGAGICVLGLALLVATDRSSSGSGSGSGSAGAGSSGGSSNPLLGDGLVLLGATLYSLCNVLQEWLLGDVHVHELLGTLGLFGCLWSTAQGLPLELHTLVGVCWTPALLVPFLGFGAAMFVFYSLVPYELKWGGAALLNISLLASDLWTALARQLLFDGFQGNSLAFFAASLAVVACGIALFTLAGDVDTRLGAGAKDSLPIAYQRVPNGGSGGHRRLDSLGGGKEAQEALEELQRQHRALQEAPVGGAARGTLPNPFEIAARSGAAGGFVRLPAADEAWPQPGSGMCSAAGSPLAAPAGPAQPAADTGSPRPVRGSFELAAER